MKAWPNSVYIEPFCCGHESITTFPVGKGLIDVGEETLVGTPVLPETGGIDGAVGPVGNEATVVFADNGGELELG